MWEPRYARCGALVLLHHPSVPDTEQAEAEVQVLDELVEGERVALLLLVDRVFPPPSAEVRAIYERALSRGDRVAAFAMLSEGIMALGLSLTMSIFIQVFGGSRRVPYKVFSDKRAAAEWLGAQVELGASVDEVCEAIDQLKAR